MKQLILTSGVSAWDLHLPFRLKKWFRVDVGDIFRDRIPRAGDVNFDKTALICQYITETQGDLIIGYALSDLKRYDSLEDAAKRAGFLISEVHFKSDELSKEGEAFYCNHGRWVGYSPEDIREMNRKSRGEIHTLTDRLTARGIKVKYH